MKRPPSSAPAGAAPALWGRGVWNCGHLSLNGHPKLVAVNAAGREVGWAEIPPDCDAWATIAALRVELDALDPVVPLALVRGGLGDVVPPTCHARRAPRRPRLELVRGGAR